jgi:hypothetical protein
MFSSKLLKIHPLSSKPSKLRLSTICLFPPQYPRFINPSIFWSSSVNWHRAQSQFCFWTRSNWVGQDRCTSCFICLHVQPQPRRTSPLSLGALPYGKKSPLSCYSSYYYSYPFCKLLKLFPYFFNLLLSRVLVSFLGCLRKSNLQAVALLACWAFIQWITASYSRTARARLS